MSLRFLMIIFIGTFILLSSCQSKSSDKNQTIAEKRKDVQDVEELDDFLNYAVDRTHRYYLPKYPIKLETYESNYFAIKTFETKHQYFSVFKPLVGIVTENPEDLQSVNQLLMHVHKNITDPKQRELTTNEILTKIVAYRNLKVGQLIPIPLTKKNTKPKLKMYRVDKIFELDSGMPAFVLLPTKHGKTPPILLFRGTNIENSTSVLADLDLKGPGLSIFLKNQARLRNWAVEISNSYSKPRIMGYSLGGSFTQYMCIYESDVINSDPRHYHVMFNQPGVSSDLVEKWYSIPKDKRPKLIGYINEGDLVSTVGNLVGKVTELSLDTLLEPIAAHVTFMTAQPILYAYRLDLTMKFDKSVSSVSELGSNMKKFLRK